MLLDVFGIFDEVFIYSHLPSVGIHGHVDDFCLRHLDALGCAAVAFGFDDDADGDRSCADADGAGVEADEVADEDRMVKDDLAHRHRDETLDLSAAVRFDRARDVYVTQNDAAEDRALRVGVARQERDANGRVGVFLHMYFDCGARIKARQPQLTPFCRNLIAAKA